MDGSIVLGRGQRNSLLDLCRKELNPCVCLRSHIILLLGDGHGWSLIAAVLFYSTATIARWRVRFEQGGIDALLSERRVRACAGAASFRGKGRLAELLKEAGAHVKELAALLDDPEK